MSIGRIILLIVATIAVAIWCVLAIKYEQTYAEITESIDETKYRYPELFCIGFAIMRFLKIDTSGKQARKRIKEIAEVQGKRYAEYYYYIINGAKWTYGLTVLVLFALLGAMGNSGIALFFGLVLSILLMWYVDETMNDQLEQRRDDLLTDLPQMLSKLTLLVNSGMVMRDAWVKVAEGEDRILYQEMRITAQEMKNGVSDYEAYRNFADRCSIKEIRRFSSTMMQNLQKGNSGLLFS